MPLDGPLWNFKIYNCKIDGVERAIIIWKSHHSLCDGVSLGSLTLSLTSEYDLSFFIKIKEPTFMQKMMIRVMAPFYLPVLLWRSITMATDKNFLTAKKNKKLSGVLNCCASDNMVFSDVKMLSKQLGCTINDLMTTVLSTAMGKFFKENGEEA